MYSSLQSHSETVLNLLKQVIDSALIEGVEKVIVVDNNSVSES
jgi:hypothetical protein